MTVLWISLAVIAALAFVIWLAVRMGRFIAGPKVTVQPPAETPVEAGDEWVQDFIHRLGRDYEERAQRVRDGRES